MQPQKTIARIVGGKVTVPHPLPPKMLYLVWYVSTLGLSDRFLLSDNRPREELISRPPPRRPNSSLFPGRSEGKSLWEHPFINTNPISFTKYNTELEISRYLDQLARSHPEVVTVFPLGRSVEGRVIKGVRVSSGGGGLKPAILLEGGIHAREWISPAVVLYVLDQLVTNRHRNAHLINATDWYFVPLLNPDGYVYSMSRDRMWRKNRAKTWRHQNTVCSGVDLNRNFGLDHAQFAALNYDPCSGIYRGPAPFSEPESRALRDFIMANRMQIKIYLSFHSFGNYILYPWGHQGAKPFDWQSLERLAMKASEAISRNSGAKYRVGSSSAMLGAAAGGSTDWVKGYAGIQYAYTIELPGGGKWGFDLPEKDIMSVSSDVFEAVKVFASFTVPESSLSRSLKNATQLFSRRIQTQKLPIGSIRLSPKMDNPKKVIWRLG
ncbi:unnamed protein product [Bemisia tabaci]|uniref:Peptidase M14 domain-containing protein n=1 Tax=Bemisia tabaci TaxID=7038 RepID=A0A9P0A7P9_BEMTA|nr:unnamed protein product [Bemisia tabaci]